MKVQALWSFVGYVGDQKYRVEAGDMLEMPDGVDWLKAGLVVEVPVEGEPVEVAAVKPAENAATRTKKPAGKTPREKPAAEKAEK